MRWNGYSNKDMAPFKNQNPKLNVVASGEGFKFAFEQETAWVWNAFSSRDEVLLDEVNDD